MTKDHNSQDNKDNQEIEELDRYMDQWNKELQAMLQEAEAAHSESESALAQISSMDKDLSALDDRTDAVEDGLWELDAEGRNEVLDDLSQIEEHLFDGIEALQESIEQYPEYKESLEKSKNKVEESAQLVQKIHKAASDDHLSVKDAQKMRDQVVESTQSLYERIKGLLSAVLRKCVEKMQDLVEKVAPSKSAINNLENSEEVVRFRQEMRKRALEDTSEKKQNHLQRMNQTQARNPQDKSWVR